MEDSFTCADLYIDKDHDQRVNESELNQALDKWLNGWEHWAVGDAGDVMARCDHNRDGYITRYDVLSSCPGCPSNETCNCDMNKNTCLNTKIAGYKLDWKDTINLLRSAVCREARFEEICAMVQCRNMEQIEC